jgi:hypothetical protein
MPTNVLIFSLIRFSGFPFYADKHAVIGDNLDRITGLETVVGYPPLG